MVSLIIMKMTDDQKQLVLDAKNKDIVCVAEKIGKKFCGLVNVVKAEGVSLTVARTESTFDDDIEAFDMAELVVEAILAAASEEEPLDEELESELDSMLKDAMEENEGGKGTVTSDDYDAMKKADGKSKS